VENNKKPPNDHQKNLENKGGETLSRGNKQPDPNPQNTKCEAKGEKTTGFKIAEFILLILVFIATATAAIYTCKQWITADDNERRGLRAYVASSDIRIQCPNCGNATYKEPSFGDRIATADLIIVTARASGNTPAYNSRVQHLDWQPFQKDIIYPDGMEFVIHPDLGKTIEGRHTILPGATRDYQIPIRVRDFEDVRNGKYNMRVYGNIDYDDVFGAKWTAEFCYVYQFLHGNDFFSACPDHQGDHARQ
jgi:hypothetical protein